MDASYVQWTVVQSARSNINVKGIHPGCLTSATSHLCIFDLRQHRVIWNFFSLHKKRGSYDKILRHQDLRRGIHGAEGAPWTGRFAYIGLRGRRGNNDDRREPWAGFPAHGIG